MRLNTLMMVAALTVVSTAAAQTRWDLPAAYPATNFHTANLLQFATDVDKATQGKLKITVNASASLFKAPFRHRRFDALDAPRANNNEYLALLRKNGKTIAPPPAQLKPDMQQVGDTMLQEWLQKAGPEGQSRVDADRKP